MLLLSAKWIDAWSIAGISVAMVFTILILLVLVLYIFNVVAAKTAAEPVKAQPATGKGAPSPTLGEAADTEIAAVTTAIYMYLNDMHDNESGVLTIQHNDMTGWHFELSN